MKQKQHGDQFKWAIGIFLSLLMLFSGFQLICGKSGKLAGRFFYPYLALEKVTGDKIADQSLLLLSREELAQKITELQVRNRELAVRALRNDELLLENRKLRNLWKLRDTTRWRSIPAEIILRDPLAWRTQFTVDRGLEDGIAPGDAVLASPNDGKLILVGVVHQVDRHTAQVRTIHHPKFRFSFRLKNSGGIGFINTANRSSGRGLLDIEYLSHADSVADGEEMVTTGFERHIPQGITIGTIRALNTVDPLYSVEKRHTGNALPAAAIEQLHLVLILSLQPETQL